MNRIRSKISDVFLTSLTLFSCLVPLSIPEAATYSLTVTADKRTQPWNRYYEAGEVRNNWYFEVWNEPEWWYLGLEYYNDLYDYTATGLKRSDSLIKVGGPACGGNMTITGEKLFQKLLDHCHQGTNAATGKTGTPIDFLTYHWY